LVPLAPLIAVGAWLKTRSSAENRPLQAAANT